MNSTFGFFSAWHSAIIDWLAAIAENGDELTTETVRQLTRYMFTAEFHEELRQQGVLDTPS